MLSHQTLQNCQFEITKLINELISTSGSLGIEKKADNSPVTLVDQNISRFFEQHFQSDERFSTHHFVSEENFEYLDYPAIILDPIDGTKELIAGLPECAVSLAILEDECLINNDAWGWIYNPFTGFSLSNLDSFVFSKSDPSPCLGFVSRSEWDSGLFQNYEKIDGLCLKPRGSIAFKLGLLASGACDFVLTLKPKNIWDIAAGTILCRQRGLKLYSSEGEVEFFSAVQLEAPLLWCKPHRHKFISEKLKVF